MAERPEDLNLPTPVVSKLISDCLPTNCKVTDEAKVAITKVTVTNIIHIVCCLSLFINSIEYHMYIYIYLSSMM